MDVDTKTTLFFVFVLLTLIAFLIYVVYCVMHADDGYLVVGGIAIIVYVIVLVMVALALEELLVVSERKCVYDVVP